MGTIGKQKWDEECSIIGDKQEIGFIDFEDDSSVFNYDMDEDEPVVISTPFPPIRGKPQSALIGGTSKCSITIKNTTSDPVELWGVRIFCSNPKGSYTLSLLEPPSVHSDAAYVQNFLESDCLEDRVLQPYQTLTIWLSCKPKELGLHTSVVYFDVGDERIERLAFLLAEDQVSQSLASGKPYLRAPRRKQFVIDEHCGSSQPSKPTKHESKYNYKLPEYNISNDVRELLQNKQVPETLMEGLRRDNYVSYFSTLINMEELHLEKEMRCYDMACINLRRKGPHLVSVEVLGLAEKRPSLVHGDNVFAKLASGNAVNNITYKGRIHRVEADEVLIKFSEEFHTNHWNGNLYNIWFTYNRLNMRRLYQALHAAADLDTDLLFPSQSTKRRLIKTTPSVQVTSSLNKEQIHSVEMILGCRGAPPFVIYGPPGTGKTKTIVEAILQIYAMNKRAKILVCAASNSAADHILEKIMSNNVIEVKETEIFRLNATSRPYEDLQPDYLRYCYSQDNVFRCPPLNALLLYRIIISTYMSTSVLHVEGVNHGHFSHLFLDEAGQASEPEIMVPMANLCRSETVVVLAGDPKQLGPVVYSQDAAAFGLGKSYLERLFDCKHYCDEDESFVIKLVRNYRCHPTILDLPSKLFYNDELLPCKEDNSSSKYSQVDFLPNKEFPVLFVGIQGCDEREGNNPSWFNRIEASKVAEIIRKLVSVTVLNETDFGVITPYRQQVVKIKKVLEAWEMQDIKVGSVEQFQGQEREVIIVSTVRSTVKHNEFDKIYSLGFLSNPRRFNVAITRARSLLIIVGNPHVVCKDPYWDRLLRHCSDNNSYQGCPLPEGLAPDPEEEDYGRIG
ncbi:probable RNA helicase SDE3 [Humulus lupulus]|uniref:probable RNA helicase SDE3 n=1 Tax=Humulus lupulus TaxID=3486 RepID=UPI002B407528|nr:probable RNA helicase SDE3 [Humulus lupulus]XP_062084561.1 probable RNA helicase SDE3 [Humulus lupulus]